MRRLILTLIVVLSMLATSIAQQSGGGGGQGGGGGGTSGTINPGSGYAIPEYGSASSSTLNPSNITTDSTGNNFLIPGANAFPATASTGGTTQYLLVIYDGTTGNVTTAPIATAGVVGVASATATSGNPLYVFHSGITFCIADNSVTVGDLLGTGTTTAGRCKDLGTAQGNGAASNIQIVGKAVTGGSAGSQISMQTVGAGHYGTLVVAASVNTSVCSNNGCAMTTTVSGTNTTASGTAAAGPGTNTSGNVATNEIAVTALATPTNGASSTANSGGTLSGNTTYYYRVWAIDSAAGGSCGASSGNTLPSTEKSQLTATGNNLNTVTITWNAVTNAAGYCVAGRTTGAELLMTPTPLAANVLTFTDTNGVTPSGAMPTTNTTGNLSVSSLNGSTVIGQSTGINGMTVQTTAGVGASNMLFLLGGGNSTTTGVNNYCLGGAESGPTAASCAALTTGNNNFIAGPYLLSAGTTANRNVIVGLNSAYNCTSCSLDVSIGGDNFSAGSTFSSSIAVGWGVAGGATFTGSYITGMSIDACRSVTSGTYLTCIGPDALFSATSDSHMVAVGDNAFNKAAGSMLSAAFGSNSCVNMTSGSYNTCDGPSTGPTVTTESYVYLGGYAADIGSAGNAPCTALGPHATCDTTYEMVLGNPSYVTKTVIQPIAYIQPVDTTTFASTILFGANGSDAINLVNTSSSAGYVGIRFATKTSGASAGRFMLQTDPGSGYGWFDWQLRTAGASSYTTTVMSLTSTGNLTITGTYTSGSSAGVTKTCTTYPTVVGGIVTGC